MDIINHSCLCVLSSDLSSWLLMQREKVLSYPELSGTGDSGAPGAPRDAFSPFLESKASWVCIHTVPPALLWKGAEVLSSRSMLPMALWRSSMCQDIQLHWPSWQSDLNKWLLSLGLRLQASKRNRKLPSLRELSPRSSGCRASDVMGVVPPIVWLRNETQPLGSEGFSARQKLPLWMSNHESHVTIVLTCTSHDSNVKSKL